MSAVSFRTMTPSRGQWCETALSFYSIFTRVILCTTFKRVLFRSGSPRLTVNCVKPHSQSSVYLHVWCPYDNQTSAVSFGVNGVKPHSHSSVNLHVWYFVLHSHECCFDHGRWCETAVSFYSTFPRVLFHPGSRVWNRILILLFIYPCDVSYDISC